MAAAAGELPALGELFAAALTAIAWVACLGVLWLYRRSLKRVLLFFADKIDVNVSIHGVGGHPLGGTAKWIRTQAENIDSYISEGAVKSEWASRKLLHAFVQLNIWMGKEIGGLAADAYNAAAALGARMGELERAAVSKVGAGVVALIHKIVNAAIAIERRTFNRSFHRTDVRLGRLEHQIGSRTRPGFEPGAIAIPKPGANIGQRVGRLEHDLKAQAKTLGKLKWLLALGGMTAFGRVFFKHFKLGWLRCGNVNRVGRALCLMDTGFMVALFSDALTVWAVSDLCRIVDAMTYAARLFAKEIDFLATQIGGLITCQGATRPKALPVDWYDPPPVVNSLKL